MLEGVAIYPRTRMKGDGQIMSNHENPDECFAKKWLEFQGYSNIEKIKDDPPDFVVEGKYAIEVRRLNRSIQVNGQTEGEETSRISLQKTIKNALAEIGPPGKNQSWVVDCEYDFSNPIPKERVIKKQIRKALLPLTQPYDDKVISELRSKYLDDRKHAHELDYLGILHLCLPCGICLELQEISTQPARFVLQNVSDGEGVLVLPELQKNIKAYIKEKSQKIKGRENNFDAWWLILIDYIGLIPNSGLTQTELEELRKEIRAETPWSRVIIVSLWNLNSEYEL